MMIPVPPISISVPNVPFYSQFADITSKEWQKRGCGIASLAMVIDYYKPQEPVSINKLLTEGISNGAYMPRFGWKHAGLVDLAKQYGLDGDTFDESKSTSQAAFDQFKTSLKSGPLIVSVHYKFDPKSRVPHLVVIDGIKGDTIYYNDPSSNMAKKEISVADFLKGWKKRFIVIRPVA